MGVPLWWCYLVGCCLNVGLSSKSDGDGLNNFSLKIEAILPTILMSLNVCRLALARSGKCGQ